MRSKQAVFVNIEIMRAFVRVRQLMEGNRDLAKKLSELEKKYDAIRNLMSKLLLGPRLGGLRDIAAWIRSTILGKLGMRSVVCEE